jgi:prepilin-type N-terminal cleavage/methylation domain-containing protein
MEQRELDTNKKDKGFTLVELLIVIVILGILATVVVFAVRGITDQGQESACDADKKSLEVAIEAYYAQYGTDNAIATQDQLVDAGLLRDESENYDIGTVDGNGVLQVTAISAEC